MSVDNPFVALILCVRGMAVQVASLMQSAKEKESAGDFAECIRICDQGLALDGGNDALTALKAKVGGRGCGMPRFVANLTFSALPLA